MHRCAPARPGRVWAIIEADSGGVYRSDDGGASWTWTNRDHKLRERAWYYMRITADPRDSDVVWAVNTGLFRSKDGGRTFDHVVRRLKAKRCRAEMGCGDVVHGAWMCRVLKKKPLPDRPEGQAKFKPCVTS